jgi:phosphatidylserine/phosphatidylglycerophosphate/cardiolipin synthase-like enzyme
VKIAISFFLLINAVTASEFNIQERIETQNYSLSVYKDVFGKAEFGLRENFKETFKNQKRKNRKKILSFIGNFDGLIPEKILRPLVYWRFIESKPENVANVLTYHMLYKLNVLRDHIDHPLGSERKMASKLLQELTQFSEINTKNIFSTSFIDLKEKGELISKLEDSIAFERAIKETHLITVQLSKKLPQISPYSLSSLGFIPGNSVKVVSKNDVALSRITWLNEHVIFNGGKLDWSQPYMSMPLVRDDNGHPAFKNDPIFTQMRDMVLAAKDSIFIDIFLFGGTMGATFAKFLIDQALLKKKINPNFKVLLLHDYATNYNMKEEMMPIFRYIKNRIENEIEVKNCVSLLQANIQRHPPGIPFGITNLIPKTDEVFHEIEKRNTYYESKIDHSKVFVIDANTNHPQAYFGSKNWSDHSGAYYYDNVLFVEGPAAALVQASYYRDVQAALTEDELELKWFFYKDEGFDNKAYLERKEEILSWMKIKKKSYPHLGKTSVRLAEADVDGTVKNVRNILVDMISKAERNIYMEQLFIYDKYIVDALIKRKLQIPTLDIKILADHNGNFGMNGLPNTLFLKEMIDNKIEIRARRLLGVTAKFPNGTEQKYHQENHRKITSIDGKVILGGSSNLNPDTLQGSFREFGAQVFSTDEAVSFEADFLKDWADHKKTHAMDIENFRAKIGGKELSKEISALINSIGSALFRAKDRLERRF